MKVIFKYEIGRRTDISLPVGSEVLSVGFQRGDIVLWVKQPTNQLKREIRTFITIFTGEEFDDTGIEYIGTTHSNDVTYVFHVYEEIK